MLDTIHNAYTLLSCGKPAGTIFVFDTLYAHGDCPFDQGTYNSRFGDVVCEACHVTVMWSSALVREGVYGGAHCEEARTGDPKHPTGLCEREDHGTQAWIAQTIEVFIARFLRAEQLVPA